MTRLQRAFGYVCLAALAGCSFGSARPLVANECDPSLACASGMCVDRVCVAVAPPSYLLALQVVPQDDDLLVPFYWTFAPETVPTDGARNLVVPRATAVVGDVRWRGVAIPAEIVFTRVSSFDGAPVEIVRATTFQTPTAIFGTVPTDYGTRLVAGAQYRVRIEPSAQPMVTDGVLPAALEGVPAYRALPAIERLLDVPAPNVGNVLRLDIDFPDAIDAPCATIGASGCAFSGIVVSMDAQNVETPESGLQVRAIRVGTEQVVSSTAVTVDGRFSIIVAPSAGDYLLRVGPGEESALVPTVTVDPDFFFPGEEPRIRVPQVEPVVYGGQVEGPNGAISASVSLAFSSSDVFDAGALVTGTFRATTTTERNNGAERFEVELLPGTYEVVVTSPTGEEAGVVVRSGVVIQPPSDGSGLIQGQLFELPARAAFEGEVRTFDDRLVPGVPIEAIALGLGTTPEARYNRSATTTSNGGGGFSLFLDSGVYDLVFRPSPRSQFPWHVVPGFSIESGARLVEQTAVLEPPFRLHGTLRTPDGEAIPGVTIRALALVDMATTPRTIEIGTAETDGGGAYTLLLPSLTP